MNRMRMTYKELKDAIAKIIPRNIEYSIDLEAGNIAIITSQMAPFTGQDGLIGKIAKRVKRKIVLRTPIDSMMDIDEAKDCIKEIIRRTPTSCFHFIAYGFSKDAAR